MLFLKFYRELKNPEETLRSMIKYKMLPQHIEAVFIQNTLKLFAHIIEKYELDGRYEEVIVLCDLMVNKLNDSIKSGELEVQERSSTTLMIMEILKEAFVASTCAICK